MGCEGTEADYELAASAAEQCLALVDYQLYVASNVEVLRVSSCLIQRGAYERYAELGIKIAETPCPNCLRYRMDVLQADASWQSEAHLQEGADMHE